MGTNEQIKNGRRGIIEKIKQLLNMVTEKRRISKGWRKVYMRLIHKKTNYRPICITSTMTKIYLKVIADRISRCIEGQQSVEQAGFR